MINPVHRSDVRKVINLLERRMISSDSAADHKGGTSTYFSNRQIILSLFRKTSGGEYSLQGIVLRLTVIDSMYSTNMTRRYFGIDDLALAIFKLGEERDVACKFNMFLSADAEPSVESLFSWTTQFGLHKNLDPAGNAISLLSKYAYYQMMLFKDEYRDGFPIYDSLAIKLMPRAYRFITGERLVYKWERATVTMNSFLENVKALRDLLGDVGVHYQTFDAIDMYLWTMGKILNGNLSLVVSRNDYIRIIQNIGSYPQGKSLENAVKERILSGDPTVFKDCDDELIFLELQRHAIALDGLN